MTQELYWLTVTVTMTALFWLPYIANRLWEQGIWNGLWDPQGDTRTNVLWADRMMRAHRNAVENLAVFAPLVLALQAVSVSTPATVAACMVYCIARAAHYIVFTLGVPLLRVIAFLVGFGAQMVLASTLLGYGR